MGNDTQQGIPVIKISLVVVAMLIAGSLVGVDLPDFLNEVIKERNPGKEVCFRVINKPRQITEVAWHVGATADRFRRELRSYNHCEPAETGEKVGLSAVQTVGGVTTCSIVAMPEGIQLGNGPKTASGTGLCSVSGTVV